MLCHVSGSSPAEVLKPLERRLSSPEAFLLSDPDALGDLGDPAEGDPAQSHIKTFTNLKKQMSPSQAVTLQACTRPHMVLLRAGLGLSSRHCALQWCKPCPARYGLQQKGLVPVSARFSDEALRALLEAMRRYAWVMLDMGFAKGSGRFPAQRYRLY